MITRVRVKNFRSLADVDVELGPLTVLVGRNGAGKSAFVDVLRFVRDALRHGLSEAVGKRHSLALLRRWSPDTKNTDIDIDLTVIGQRFRAEYGFSLGDGESDSLRITREICKIGNDEGADQTIYHSENGQWQQAPLNAFVPGSSERVPTIRNDYSDLFLRSFSTVMPDLTYLTSLIASTKFCTFYPDTLRRPQQEGQRYAIADDGSNLGSVLLGMKQDGTIEPVLSTLQKLVSGLCDITVDRVADYLVTSLVYAEKDGKERHSQLAQESDGTLRLLAILTALYKDNLRTLLSLEEPEIMLHPGTLAFLSDNIREAASRFQVIITTQSPDLISRFAASELRIVDRESGVTQIGPLDETQRDAINEQLFSAGDLLRIEGLHRAAVTVPGGYDA